MGHLSVPQFLAHLNVMAGLYENLGAPTNSAELLVMHDCLFVIPTQDVWSLGSWAFLARLRSQSLPLVQLRWQVVWPCGLSHENAPSGPMSASTEQAAPASPGCAEGRTGPLETSARATSSKKQGSTGNLLKRAFSDKKDAKKENQSTEKVEVRARLHRVRTKLLVPPLRSY